MFFASICIIVLNNEREGYLICCKCKISYHKMDIGPKESKRTLFLVNASDQSDCNCTYSSTLSFSFK